MGSSQNKPSLLQESQENTFFSKIWRYCLSGVLVTSPIALTLYIVWYVITAIDNTVKSLIPPQSHLFDYIPLGIPGLGIILAFVFFTVVGAFATGVLGRLLIRIGENFLNRMPVVRNLYAAVKQIFEAIFHREKTSFREVVLVEYPRKGIWSLGFVTGLTKGEVQQDTTDEVLNVFIPTTPNPTSGFLLFVPKRDIQVLSMSVEDGIKMVVSAGIITPRYHEPNNPMPKKKTPTKSS